MKNLKDETSLKQIISLEEISGRNIWKNSLEEEISKKEISQRKNISKKKYLKEEISQRRNSSKKK